MDEEVSGSGVIGEAGWVEGVKRMASQYKSIHIK